MNSCHKKKHKEYGIWCDKDDHCHDHCDDHDYYKDDWSQKHEKCNDCKKSHGKCVAEVLEAIHEAQKKAKKSNECKISCKESIDELLGESHKPKKNTIPFILYCGDCEPFKATGVTTFSHSKHKKFACITTFIFRIKEIDEKCAVLELLIFKPEKCSSEHCKKRDSQKCCSPCGQIDCKNVDDLMKTGICINVDLSCFCAVTCLPAIRL